MGILERILDILLRIEKHITGNNKEIQKTESAAEITKTTGKLKWKVTIKKQSKRYPQDYSVLDEFLITPSTHGLFTVILQNKLVKLGIKHKDQEFTIRGNYKDNEFSGSFDNENDIVIKIEDHWED